MRQSSVPEGEPFTPLRTAPACLTQEQLFPLVSRLPEINRTYTTYQAYRVRGAIDSEALGNAVDQVVARHEALRTCLGATPAGLRQLIGPARTGSLRSVDLRAVPPSKAHGVLAQSLLEESETLFRIADEPLSRFTLFRIADDDQVVMAVIHHLVFDGWSFGVLWREVTELYRAARAGEPPALPPVKTQFTDFVARQREWLEQDEAQEQIRFWLDELRGCATGATLPYDDIPVSAPTRAGARLPVALSAELSARVALTARRERVTVAAITLLALQLVISRATAVDDVVVGVPMGNRTSTDDFDAMGFFVNAHALRMRLDKGRTPRELVRSAAHKLLAAMINQRVPLPAVVAASRVDQSPGLPSALFRVIFTFHNEPNPSLELGATRTEWWNVEDRTRRADLTLHIGRHGDRIAGEFEYSTQLYRPETIERFTEAYTTTVQEIIDDLDDRAIP
ncbi:condensation domain-containing protein [Streptomyces sp. NBC_00365]|uniref:condensation domain-containing protein n=1 Tax=Streptomyces sp. NBC_00365 TaxID=2975726 RepID=UPI0022564C48|nr:condensation domain-containing protein [Streptomyces sp. NBC_00365]MCX5088309.1 condensation domain-containing protein [Streptomyces sp. NBC_00365]